MKKTHKNSLRQVIWTNVEITLFTSRDKITPRSFALHVLDHFVHPRSLVSLLDHLWYVRRGYILPVFPNVVTASHQV